MTKTKGGRPRKAPLTDQEFKIAVAMLEGRVPGVRGSWRDAARALIRLRTAAATPAERKALTLSFRSLMRAVHARGWCGKTQETMLAEARAAEQARLAALNVSTPGRPATEEGTLPGTSELTP